MWRHKQEKKSLQKEDTSFVKFMLISCKKNLRKDCSAPSDHIPLSPVPGSEHLHLNVTPSHPPFYSNFLLKIEENNNANKGPQGKHYKSNGKLFQFLH